MVSVWQTPELSDEIIKGDEIFESTTCIVADIVSAKIDIMCLVQNMAGVLTSKEVEYREKGMRFFTKVLKELPKDYLTQMQVRFISNFYTDRLRDYHRVIPPVLEGYLAIFEMENYDMQKSGEFLRALFREVPCQSQVRQDRLNIYLIIKKLLEKDVEHMKSMGPNFAYGFISAMDGERDPRNLLFLFEFIPTFLRHIPLGHLVDGMFEVISCYYPIDFHPSPDDPQAVSRQDLADELGPCLCAIPEFGEQCLILLIDKLDSTLRTAKMDSLKLLALSCRTFKAEAYGPFLKALWSSLNREISHKTDDELKMSAHEALSTLIAKLATSANTDQVFENFIKGILISMQTAIAESTTVAQLVQATKVLLTTANASKESCVIVTKAMIPAALAYYELNPSPKLQIATLDFLGDLNDITKHWESELVLPFVEVLIHNIQHSQENDVLSVSVEAVHAIARKYPELIMSYVVKGKCDLDNLTRDKDALQKRLNLLSNLASIDDFTKVIIEEMLKVITSDDQDASKVVEALSESMSNASLYTVQKVTQIESDYGLINSILTWLLKELSSTTKESLTHGFALISNTMSSLPAEKQQIVLSKHMQFVLEKSKTEESYFVVLECLYNSLHETVYEPNFPDIMSLSLQWALLSDNDEIRNKACGLVAHFLNKAPFGDKFDALYEVLKNHLSSCNRDDEQLCPKVIMLYGWIAKALVLRGSDMFHFWLQKIIAVLSHPNYTKLGAKAIHLIMTDFPDHLNAKYHCRISLLYRQRMFQNFSVLTEKLAVSCQTKESVLLSWAYILERAPKSVLNNEIKKVAPLVIDSLLFDNKDLLLVMTDVLSHFVKTKHMVIADSTQTILPRLLVLTKYVKSMDVRINSLQCLFDIANTYPTQLVLPYKQDVLFDLAPSLDDKKRLVRNMSVKARTRWFLIGAPGEPTPN
ncbi:hypothetical protein MSG28_009825 [Choristoneura fumiferana]|uniref:Uncharacterized protein n=1 Tax=Choristoneura fumiferana TaxID=7141 RepID=A0ACC0JCU2_CHOFU|nr:hypothetical protein MSG28_009825 [Choristoneura fumiferana]